MTTKIYLSTLLLTVKADSANLVQKLTNPIANLTTITIQMTYDHNIRPNYKYSRAYNAI